MGKVAKKPVVVMEMLAEAILPLLYEYVYTYTYSICKTESTASLQGKKVA